MDDVKRYDLQQPDSHMGSAYMQPEDYGDYVKYADYAALKARLEAVVLERDYAQDVADKDHTRAERAEAALATARRDALKEALGKAIARNTVSDCMSCVDAALMVEAILALIAQEPAPVTEMPITPQQAAQIIIDEVLQKASFPATMARSVMVDATLKEKLNGATKAQRWAIFNDALQALARLDGTIAQEPAQDREVGE